MAIYCPLWHRYPHMDAWKGEGWTEWTLLQNATPRFKGHYQPLRPTWGCFDETDPKWSAKEIDLAADHGIDVFLVDWYWYNGVKLMEETLERGLLRAPNRRRVRFALMWANHHWADYFPAPYTGTWNWWLPSRHSLRDLENVIDYGIEHYFRQPNYWRLEDRLFFSVHLPVRFIEALGGSEKTKRALRRMDRRLHARGLPAMHWNCMTNEAARVPELKSAGFQSVTTYNVKASGKIGPTDEPIEQYEDIMKAHRRHWHAMSQTALPHFPVVTVGWDVTPRCRKDVPWPFKPSPTGCPNLPFPDPSAPGERVYPYIHVVVGNTPQRFERLCRNVFQHLRETQATPRVVLLNAWNEWTEGCFLLPEKRYGDGYLKAIRNAFGATSQ